MTTINMIGIHRPSKRSLTEYLNLANSTELDPENLIFSIPVPTDGTWRSETTDRNTAVRITASHTSPFKDTIVVTYDRLNLADMNQLLDFKIKTRLPETTHDLLHPIWLRYGIFLDADDIVDEALVDVNAGDLGPDPVYTLTARIDALGWTGACTISVGEGAAVIGDYLLTPQLPGLNYPVPGDGTQGSALVYMYALDFTDVKDVLETYPVDLVTDEFSDDLLTAVQLIDTQSGSELWNLDPVDPEWSLHGATVVYNGLNDAALPTNTSYKYVLGLQLRDDVTTPPGVMYLHYNDPFDPDAV